MSDIYGLMRYVDQLENKDIIVESIKQLVMVKKKIVKVSIRITTEEGFEGSNTLYLNGYRP